MNREVSAIENDLCSFVDYLFEKYPLFDKEKLFHVVDILLGQGFTLELLTKIFSVIRYYPTDYFIALLPKFQEQIDLIAKGKRIGLVRTDGDSSNWIVDMLDVSNLILIELDEVPYSMQTQYVDSLSLDGILTVDDHTLTGLQVMECFERFQGLYPTYAIVANAGSNAIRYFSELNINLKVVGDGFTIPMLLDLLCEKDYELLATFDRNFNIDEIPYISSPGSYPYFTEYKLPDTLTMVVNFILINAANLNKPY